MGYLGETLELLRERTEGSRARQGWEFERMVRKALQDHPGEYGPARFKHIYLWSDWPDRDGPDHGIDLVAEEVDGGLCAIQCKFYESHKEIPAKDVDSFLAASEGRFASRILIATGELSKRGWQHVESADPHCEVLSAADMDSWVTDWRLYIDNPDNVQVDGLARHEPRPDQLEALDAIDEGFKRSDRGQLIWPCGTGKSVLAMWAAERVVGVGGSVLYLVPSLSLMGQTMREWARHKTIPHSYLGVCSDKTSGRRDDDSGGYLNELAMPVSTDVGKVAEALEQLPGYAMRVVFCTYQSAKVVSDAQLKSGAQFDLAICDEAHRTTGLSTVDRLSIDDPSGFTLIHQEDRLVADRRLFMTATPRVYTEQAKKRAGRRATEAGYGFDVDSYSMDDEEIYGPIFHQMTFASAIGKDLLSDYEVLVIAVKDKPEHRGGGGVLDVDGEVGLSNEHAVKLLGCWDALADPTTKGVDPNRHTGMADDAHARSAIVFSNTVKVSKTLAEWWPRVVARHTPVGQSENGYLHMDVAHIDGSTSALRRISMLQRLKDARDGAAAENSCRVLTNARVLTEGVNVPALDSIIFFERRTSTIDITQAVGRVMRTAEGKKIGRVVIPVVVPEGMGLTDREVLNGSDFKVVWDVVRALRSHDERIQYWINDPKTAAAKGKLRIKIIDSGTDQPVGQQNEQLQLLFAQVPEAVASKLVEMCGDRRAWITWGERAARVCGQVHQKFVQAIEEVADARQEFKRFVRWMRTTVNPSVDDADAAEMVAQHVVTMPVFDHMFADSRFADMNPVSQAIQKLLAVVDPANTRFEAELAPLERAYQSMRKTFDGAIDSADRVDVLRQVYEGFFHHAMKDTVKRLGIVYTPVELVDFILRSADAVCKQEFGKGLGAEGVNVLDPFTGTGTFIYRLLTGYGSDGKPLIAQENLVRKYTSELHANEMVLLAYYIAALKIEAGYAERCPDSAYEDFPGIVFGDTFLLSDEERQAQLETMQRGYVNSERGLNQATTQIQVIVGNPPWSAGQKSAGDDNANEDYDHIAERVREVYGQRHREVTGGGSGKSAGNLYVQAIRWATDRLDRNGGIIAFVHPNSLLNGTSLAGMRASLRDEFTDVYVVNLRGNAYTSGDEFRREGDKIFGQGSRNGVQITVLVSNPAKDCNEPARLHYAQVPDAQSLEAKFAWIEEINDVTSTAYFDLVPVTPRHNWINLSDGSFNKLLAVCNADRSAEHVALRSHALGIATNLDSYVYSYSRGGLVEKINRLISTFNSAIEDVKFDQVSIEQASANVDLSNIKWTGKLKSSLKKAVKEGEKLEFDESRIREVLYRPFIKKWLYEDDRILSSNPVSDMFPRSEITPPPRWEPFSRTSPSRFRSESSPAISPTTCVSQEDRPGAFREHGDHRSRAVEHGRVRSAGSRPDSGPSPDSTRPTDKSTAQETTPLSSDPSTQAIVIKRPGGGRGEHSSPLATDAAPDLHLHTDGGGGGDPPLGPAILITPPPTSPFIVLATSIPPDLAALKGSMQSRAIPRNRRSP